MYSRTRKLVQRHYQMISFQNGLSQGYELKLTAPFKLSVLEQKASEQLDLRELKGPRARVNSYSFKLIYINYSVKEWR